MSIARWPEHGRDRSTQEGRRGSPRACEHSRDEARRSDGVLSCALRGPGRSHRQAGRFKRKGDANKASLEKVNELNALCTTSSAAHTTPGVGPSPSAVLTFARWHEIWPKRVRRDKRTISTNEHRINKYIIPHLPDHGRIPVVDLNRGMLHDVQVALLEAGYAKSTIDGALSSLSAVLGYAMDEERIEANVAYRMTVNPDDPLLEPDQRAAQAPVHTPRRVREVLQLRQATAPCASVSRRW